LGEGTEAASEVVSNPAYLDAVLQKAPRNWDKLNLEAVIEANVIEGHPVHPLLLLSGLGDPLFRGESLYDTFP
jgi:hypothetical protein